MHGATKRLAFCRGARDELFAFSATARRQAGYQLDRVQNGIEPSDWKPMTTVGPGVREIRIRDSAGAFRVLYGAKLAEAIYVLHCFEKKSQATPKQNLSIAANRYRTLIEELS